MNGSTTFSGLVEQHGRIEIPVIQRDYAQGRADQSNIRDDFLDALKEALLLPKQDPSLPINLDFVYGSVINNAFQPLDGQQRLTTLFLLHWYLAWNDGCIEEFQNRFVTDSRSRFGYDVRPSSRDFMNSLANYSPNLSAINCSDLRVMIEDQPWFFRNWRFDPTILSAMNILKRMHEMFKGTNGLFARIMDKNAPAITFQLLDLEQFDLSDDLYIKMNARGKPLTPFETFKARFEKHLSKNFEDQKYQDGAESFFDYFSDRIDKRWAEFFWHFRDKSTHSFDNAILNLIRIVILVTRDPDADSATDDITDLRKLDPPSGFSWFDKRDWLDQSMALGLFALLDRWSEGDGQFHSYLPDKFHLDEQVLFGKIISDRTSLTYQQFVQFSGYLQFLTRDEGEIDTEAFGKWMRVVSNLAINTDYNRPADLRRSLAALKNLTPFMDDILCHLANPETKISAFSGEQIAEERMKAHLILIGEGWPERIKKAERHPYFNGQIGFLLVFSGFDLSNVDAEISRVDQGIAKALCIQFDHYFACAEKMVQAILEFPSEQGRLWERALLAVGDFLLYHRSNHSLLVTASDEPLSWKRLFRNAGANGKEGLVLKDLWDQLSDSENCEADLVKIVEQASGIDPWRFTIINTSAVYDFGRNKMIRFTDNGKIYLLRKSQMNGAHAELYTYGLYEKLKADPKGLALKLDYYESNSSDDEPGLKLSHRRGKKDAIFYLTLGENPDVYELYLYDPKKPNPKFKSALETAGFEVQDGYLTKSVSQEDMEAAVISLDCILQV